MPSSDRPMKVQLFESAQIRSEWDAEAEKWWFSVLDVVAVLTDQPEYKKVRNYWKWLKNKLIAEGSQLVSATNQLKLEVPDGKLRLTDVLDDHESVAKRGGGVARQARLKLELETGKKLVSPQNAKQLRALGQRAGRGTKGQA